MVDNLSLRRYRTWYAQLLRLYPKPYYEHFGEGMEQTFNDLCRERVAENRSLFTFSLWILFETSVGILRENLTFTLMKNQRLIIILSVIAFILFLPLVAMQLTDEVNWGLGDFVIVGILLLSAGLGYELVARKVRNTQHRLAIGIAIVIAVLIIWADLAVGIFNIPGISGS